MFVEEKLQDAKGSVERALKDALRLETEILFTLNVHYFNSKRDVYLSRYKSERREVSRAPQQFNAPQFNAPQYQKRGSTATERALSALAELGYEGLTSEDLGSLLKSDPFEEEITVMADVMAYFHVAYKVRSIL